MALAFQSGESVKQALFEELQNILSADKDTRMSAEGKIRHLEFTEGYGVYLAELTMNQSFDLALRQLASVMLKKYAEDYWANDELDGTQKAVVATNQAKDMIRKILPNGLYDPNSKIRASVAYTISAIAAVDWPHTWTDLFDIIVKCLGGNEDSIHGAMQVLVEFSYDSVDCRVAAIGPVILNEIYRIFESEQMYSVNTRTCAVTIFKSLLKAINQNILNKDQKAKLLNPVLPVFINKLIGALGSSGQHTSYALKTEIIKVLTYMVNEMSKFIYQYNDQILPPVWSLLTQTAEIYVKAVVNETDSAENGQDDDELNNFITLVLQLFEFIHSIVEQHRFQSIVKSVLTDLVYISIVYMQITEEQATAWADDAELYVDDMCAEVVECSIRVSSKDVLVNIGDEFGAEVLLPSINDALTRHVQVAEAEKNANNPHSWKIIEASVTAVGFLKKYIVDGTKENQKRFNLREYLAYTKTMLGQGGIVGTGYEGDVSPLLHGRCLWVLSKYADAAPDIYDRQQLQSILDCMTNNFNGAKPMVVQISAMRALFELCTGLKKASEEQRSMVIPHLPCFLNFITDIAIRAKGSILIDVLSTISAVAAFDKNFTANNHTKMISFTIATFLKSFDDPFVLQEVQEIIHVLAENECCIIALQERLVPTLVSILSLESNSNVEKKSCMQDTAMDILGTVVQNSPVPLSPILVNTAFPATVKCILATDDNAIMQSGGECLRAFISVSSEQICSYNNGEGLNYIMQVATMLLNPMSNEFTATFVGRLIITIVTKAGNFLGDNIQLLLKAVISKLQLVEALNVVMSLVMTFAHLIITQMEAVLNFLSSVPGPSGTEPAIQFVLSNWLPRQPMFYGTYERKVSTMALCKLFEHGVTTNDVRLVSVTIRDVVELSVPLDGRPRTRRQSSNNQQKWIDVPVLVKIFKLLINDTPTVQQQNGNTSQKLFHVSDLWCDDDEDEDDELLKELEKDPIFQTSLNETLTKFLQNFATTERFAEYAQHLNEEEKRILRGIQVNV
ncbi:importin-9 isoform X2 [Contarinia nasturtii]|uniref:importin-9 isoform X2 n=1 Tax=Contarinia nasturtii TaxID=265458 RepID=UPI0012D475C2|nr:importin-9 isoform X2 [Contarinia nasturtii]